MARVPSEHASCAYTIKSVAILSPKARTPGALHADVRFDLFRVAKRSHVQADDNFMIVAARLACWRHSKQIPPFQQNRNGLALNCCRLMPSMLFQLSHQPLAAFVSATQVLEVDQWRWCLTTCHSDAMTLAQQVGCLHTRVADRSHTGAVCHKDSAAKNKACMAH